MSQHDARSWAGSRALNFRLFKGGQLLKTSPVWKDLDRRYPGEVHPNDVSKLIQEGIGNELVPFRPVGTGREFLFGGKPIPASFFDAEIQAAFGAAWPKALAAAQARCTEMADKLTSRLDFLTQVFQPVSTQWLKELRP